MRKAHRAKHLAPHLNLPEGEPIRAVHDNALDLLWSIVTRNRLSHAVCHPLLRLGLRRRIYNRQQLRMLLAMQKVGAETYAFRLFCVSLDSVKITAHV